MGEAPPPALARGAVVVSTRSAWATRRARAAHLLREAPHAEEMLVFYIGLTEVQERVAGRVPVKAWLEALRAPPGTAAPLRPSALPTRELLPHFEAFLEHVAEIGTDVMASGSAALLAEDAAARATALRDAAGFHARGFLEPVLTTLAGSNASPAAAASTADPSGRCPTCGSPPVVGTLRDAPEALGRRGLVCPLCATEWRFDRLRCPACGETDADQLLFHVAESVAHVRVDECRSCARYLKTVDLRARGDAVPVVDELATLELDLWARERGFEKIQSNVLEL